MTDTSSPAITVVLKRGRSKPFWVGHPWVFSGGVHRVTGDVPEMGGPCLVEDERGNVLGAGFYNPHGKIAVRILQHRRSTDLDFSPQSMADIVRARLTAARDRRVQLGFPNAQTNAFRVCHAEGDLLTGLVIDQLGDVAVVHTNSRAMYEQRELIADITSEVLELSTVVVAVSDASSRLEAIPVGVDVLRGELSGPVEIQEEGVRYRLDLLGGQKTGFYADQRENRKRFAAFRDGQDVLDLYTYVGGFGLHAALGNASSVVAVDTSEPACRAAQANAELNGVDKRFEVHCMDAMTFLKEARGSGRRWSRIICDPPKLARGRSHLKDAIKKYTRLNTLAMSALTPDGMLLTCSCSQHVSDDAFVRLLTDAGHRLRRGVHVHALWSQGLDHPFAAVAPEGRYLTAALVSLEREKP